MRNPLPPPRVQNNNVHGTPVQQVRQEKLQMQHLNRQMRNMREIQGGAPNHHQQQRQQQPRSMPLPPPPLPPPPQQQQQQQVIRQHFAMQRPPRPPPPSPFLNAFPQPLNPLFIQNTYAATAAVAASPVLVPQNSPLQVPQQPLHVHVTTSAASTPAPTPANASNLAAAVAADLFPSPQAAVLAPPYQNMGMLLNANSGIANGIPLDIRPLQRQQQEYVQQQLMDNVRQLPIPVEIQQQIHGHAADAPPTVIEMPNDIVFNDAMDMEGLLAAEQEQQAEVQRATERAAAEEEARQEARRLHRKVQNTENKRKSRQRSKEEKKLNGMHMKRSIKK